ncbi:DEAD/DEAH box helicase [Leptolyngbya sp. FACHB-671]|uniref:DEAD/DEAH box helicase n=1 Tax=Leptolyngbya sp. FACHB-671 TaxID=2692812 RepID=UPI00168737F0|nr:DEAD/DEAH box helicase [Leptolyngbya sp. FACHB-671]MBD2066947.1 DEAD/DEAH box helicase [Leptolyngbya sp. FACHB-671]
MSSSDRSISSGFDQLHERVQRWIWQQQWMELRDIQEQAIAPILSAQRDVILSAATAGGKTEAAFLPIFSKLMDETGSGIQVLYISPLKALINDQYRRLSAMGELLEIPIHPWHGDIDAGRKQRALKHPSGVVLITPESLEALFVRRGYELAGIFQALRYLVIDELHSFIGAERGKQLQSLMHRVEQVAGHAVPRIGLSATLGDMGLAAEFIRSGEGEKVLLIQPEDDEGQELKIQVRGYRELAPDLFDLEDEEETEVDTEATKTAESRDKSDIAAHLFKVLRGTNNLIFINRRADVEAYADRLRRLCEQQKLPNEFLPHHGSLSKDLREEAEQALKGDRPTTVVCTTTLEMGIDIGSMTSIAQVGAPFSVTSTRQRLGRSGRREGDAAIMRFYISEPEVTPYTSPQDSLHPELMQAIAIVNLLLERWCEPPIVSKLHLSTLIQQVLSLIAERGGVRAKQAWETLCQKGAFTAVDQALFIQLLRCLGAQDLIQQTQEGLLLLGLKGEKLVNHYSFFTAFQTPEEYRIVTHGKTLGTLPVEYPLTEGLYLIFAGHRWRVLAVDQERRIVDVERAAAGRVPSFSGNRGWIHDRIREEMYRLYVSKEVPIFLDAIAHDLLSEARTNFNRFHLANTPLLSNGQQTLLFCWKGDLVMNTILVQLQAKGLRVGRDAIALTIEETTPAKVLKELRAIAAKPPVNPVVLAATVRNKISEKYDPFLSEELLCQNYASSYLDTRGAWATISELVSN